MSDIQTGAHPDISWYIIVDTNWLLTQPLAKSGILFPAQRHALNVWELFAVRYLLPYEVKQELTGLKSRNHDHREIANARRWLVHLFSLIRATWEKSRIITDESGILESYYGKPNHGGVDGQTYIDLVRSLPLVSCAEVDLGALPSTRTDEGSLGADSPTDRRIVGLARMIASPPLSKYCFIATEDTGIHAEVASLFYKRGLPVGCPATISDYILGWKRAFETGC
jgi:hypothetical protein